MRHSLGTVLSAQPQQLVITSMFLFTTSCALMFASRSGAAMPHILGTVLSAQPQAV